MKLTTSCVLSLLFIFSNQSGLMQSAVLQAQTVIDDNFDDGDFEDSAPGLWRPRNSNGVASIVEGDLFLDWKTGSAFPVQLLEVNGNPVVDSNAWSIRALMAVNEGERGGVGVAPQDQTAGVNVNSSGNGAFNATLRVNDRGTQLFSDENFPYEYGDDIYVQYDGFGSTIVGRMWLPGKPEDAISLRLPGISNDAGRPAVFSTVFSDATFREVTAANSPLPVWLPNPARLSIGHEYKQDFDEMGVGGAGTRLPEAWSITDEVVPHLVGNRITTEFPETKTRLTGSGPFVYNAGNGEDSDRALAVARPRTTNPIGETIQFSATSPNSDVDAVRLSFATEAWDLIRARSSNVPGEVGFDVSILMKTDQGNTELVHLGTTAKTGLGGTEAEFVDGNAPENRLAFNSGVIPVTIPANAELSFHWTVDHSIDASEEWIFGIDDVGIMMGIAGDTDLNGRVNFADFLVVADNFGKEGSWEQGDFTGDGQVTFPDFLELAENFDGQSSFSAAAVPEPTSTCTVLFGMLSLICLRKRRCYQALPS